MEYGRKSIQLDHYGSHINAKKHDFSYSVDKMTGPWLKNVNRRASSFYMLYGGYISYKLYTS
jgi:hypothetical protein